MTGMIQGGWEYVYAAWGLSLGLLLAYSIAVEVRSRRGGGDDAR
jgi:hypothetical protein